MVLGKLPVPGRPTIWITVGQGPIALAVGAGGGGSDIFTLLCPFSPLSPSLWETARYRLKYCLKGPLNPKQPTNQPFTGFSLTIYLESFTPTFGQGTPVFSRISSNLHCGTPTFSKRCLWDSYFQNPSENPAFTSQWESLGPSFKSLRENPDRYFNFSLKQPQILVNGTVTVPLTNI